MDLIPLRHGFGRRTALQMAALVALSAGFFANTLQGQVPATGAAATQPVFVATQPATQPTSTTQPTGTTQPATSRPVAQSQPTRVYPTEPEPSAVFASLYGAEIRRVEATPTPKDDRELGRKLLTAGRDAGQTPLLQKLLFLRAVEYAGKDPGGLFTVVPTIGALRELEPANADMWDDKAIATLERSLRTIDFADRPLLIHALRATLIRAVDARMLKGQQAEAAAFTKRLADLNRLAGAGTEPASDDLLRAVAARQKHEKRVTEVFSRLESRMPVDAATLDEVQQLLVAVLPRQADLQLLAKQTGNESIKSLADIASKPREQLTPAQTAWLGDWCRAAAGKAIPGLRDDLLRHAAALYADFLIAAPYDETDRVRVRLAARQVLDELAELHRQEDPPLLRRWGFELLLGPSFEGLALVQPDRQAISGTWKTDPQGWLAEAPAAAAVAVGAPAAATLAIPVWPGAEYEVAVRFRNRTATTVGVVLPVGSSSTGLLCTAEGWCLTTTKGKFHLTGIATDIAKDVEPHVVHAKVMLRNGVATVVVLQDGVEAGRWEGLPTELLPPPGAQPDRAAIGLLAGAGQTVFSNVSVLCGKGTPRWLGAPSASEIGWDGSPPRDLSWTKPSAGVTKVSHYGATFSIDPMLPGGASLSVADASEEVRLLHIGFHKMMSDSKNLAPLGIDYNRYKRLVAMSSAMPRAATEADIARLRELVKQRDFSPPSSEARFKAEWSLCLAIHTLADNQRAAITNWAAMLAKSLSPAELALARKMAVTN